MAKFTFDEYRAALRAGAYTPEAEQELLKTYPYLKYDKQTISSALADNAYDEPTKEKLIADFPEFVPQPSAGILDVVSNVPAAALAATGESVGGITRAAEELIGTGTNYGQDIATESRLAGKQLSEELNLQPDKSMMDYGKSIVYGGATSAAQQLPLVAAAVANPALTVPVLGAMGVMSGGTRYNQAREENYTPGQAAVQGALYGGAEIAGEYLPLKTIMEKTGLDIGSLASKVVKYVATEVGSELGTEAAQYATDKVAQMITENPDANIEEFWPRMRDTALQTLVAAPLLGGAGALTQIATQPAPQNMEQTTADLTQPEVDVEDAEVIKAAEEEIKAEQAAQEEAQPPINIPRPTFERPQPPAENQVEMARRMLSEGYKPKDIITALRQRTAVTVGEAERLQGEAIPEGKGMTIQPTAPSNKLDQLFKREEQKSKPIVSAKEQKAMDKLFKSGNIEEKAKADVVGAKMAEELNREEITKQKYSYAKTSGLKNGYAVIHSLIKGDYPQVIADINAGRTNILDVETALNNLTKIDPLSKENNNYFLDKIKSSKTSPEPQQATEVAPKDITPQPAEPAAVKTPPIKVERNEQYQVVGADELKDGNTFITLKDKEGNIYSGALPLNSGSRNSLNILRDGKLKIKIKNIDDFFKGNEKVGLMEFKPLSEPAVKTPEVKEPWQMTKDEFNVNAKPFNEMNENEQQKAREEFKKYDSESIEEAGFNTWWFDKNSGKVMAEDGDHRFQVKTALTEGKPVPPEVLAEYPDLKVEQKAETKPNKKSIPSVKSPKPDERLSVKEWFERVSGKTEADYQKEKVELEKELENSKKKNKEIEEKKDAEHAKMLEEGRQMRAKEDARRLKVVVASDVYSEIETSEADKKFAEHFKEKGVDPLLSKMRGAFSALPNETILKMAKGYGLSPKMVLKLTKYLKEGIPTDDMWSKKAGIGSHGLEISLGKVKDFLIGKDAVKEFKDLINTEIILTEDYLREHRPDQERQQLLGYTNYIDDKIYIYMPTFRTQHYGDMRTLKATLVHEARHVQQIQKGQRYLKNTDYEKQPMEIDANKVEERYKTGESYLVAPMPSNQQQEAINTLAGLDQTDLIMMVEALDAIPEVKKRLRNEQALGQFVKKDNGRIVLPAKMGQADKNMVAKVLAHELGHLVDWSTGAVKNKMPKGNIFAHIGAMAKYFKKTLNLEPGATPENLTAKERAKIRYKAKKETIQPDGTYDKIALKNRYRELIAEYIKDNNLIERETVVMELLDLTQKWWGITDEMMADEKYLTYLSKPSELYANAFSAFLTEPATFEALAPQTSQMIYDYMTEERPQFYQIYKMFQDAMQKGESLQNKITWLRDRIKLASEKRLAYKLTKAPETSTGTLFKKQYIDSMSALLDLAKVPGQKIDYDFINKIELYRNNRDVMEGYLLEFMPEINDELKKQGLSIDGIGIDAFLKRIIGERGLKFLDVVSKDMAEQMNAAIQAKYTPEQMKAINNTFVKIWEQRKKNILEPLKNNEFLPDEIIDYMLKTKDYQTWDVGEQYENLYSKSSPATGSVIKKQIGTFKAVANPAISTILKDLSLLRFLGKQMATKAVIDKLKQHGVTVPEAKKKYNGAFWQFVEPDSKSGQELVMLSTKDGIKGYYVDKSIAEALENKPLEINSIIKMMLLPNKIIRGSFTGWNPAFLMLLNPIRDVQGSFLKMPYVLQNFGEWSKDMAVELYKAVTNTQNKKQIAEQTKAGNLIGEHESVLDPDLIKTEEQSIEAMYKGQQHDYKKYGVAVDKLMGLFDMFQALGKRLERFPKLAADKFYQAIKSKYNLSDAEINYFIRNFAGSPDFRRKGTQYANYNNLFLYSNAAKEGYRAHIDSAKYSPTEYFVKMAGASIGYMGALMLLESAFKDWWDKVPEYYKTNYYVIPSPFGHYDENGKPVFWTIPKDEASRFIGSAFRKIFKFNPEAWLESLTQIAAVGADELPMTSPILKALGILSQAGTGVIPTDSRTGRPLISQRDWDIRTKEPMTTITALAKAISNQTGGGAWWKFDTTKKDNVATPSDIEKLSKMPMFGLNVLGRFLRVGDTENKFAKYEESKDRKGDIAYELTQIDRLVAEKLKPAFEKYKDVPKAIATLTREEKKLLSLHEVYFKDKMLEVSNPKLFKRKQDLLEQRRNKKFELNRNK